MQATVFWQRIRQLQEEDITVHVTVESANKGGMLVKYGVYDGFVPVSQFGPVSFHMHDFLCVADCCESPNALPASGQVGSEISCWKRACSHSAAAARACQLPVVQNSSQVWQIFVWLTN